MLDDDAYRNYLDQCGFSDSARTLLTDIRRSPPVRRVAGGREIFMVVIPVAKWAGPSNSRATPSWARSTSWSMILVC
jgi:hypothetical protein